MQATSQRTAPQRTRRAGQHLRGEHPTPSIVRPALAVVAAVALAVVGFVGLRSPGASSEPAATATPTTAAPAPVVAPPTTRESSAAGAAPLLGWVAVIDMVDRDAGRDELEAALAPMRGVVPSARVIETDDYASLPEGAWAIVDGPFESGREAAEYCMIVGAVVGAPCQGRVLSTDQQDRIRSCWLDGDALRGTCDG